MSVVGAISVTLKVPDLEPGIEFYSDAGLVAKRRGQTAEFYCKDQERPSIILLGGHERKRLHHITLRARDLAAIAARTPQAGGKLTAALAQSDGIESGGLWIEDPHGMMFHLLDVPVDPEPVPTPIFEINAPGRLVRKGRSAILPARGYPLPQPLKLGHVVVFYPEHAQWVPQYTLERVMLERLRTLKTVEIKFDTTLLSAEQDVDGVTARVATSSGGEDLIGAKYLIGADGARSRVRDLLGAKMEGRGALSKHYNVIFRAPGLAVAHRHGPANMYWQISARGLSVIGPMDRDDTWFFMPAGLPEGGSLSSEQASARIVESTGINLPYEILSADQWTAHELIADSYGRGRIFLAGDACHLHPPFGGYGMNMGIADGVDLGWKIAAVLQGWGDPSLVGSYEAERRPVHQKVIAEAMANYAIVGGPPAWPKELEDDTPEGAAIRQKVGAQIQSSKTREFYTLGTVLGLAYQSSPIIVSEEGDWSDHDSQTYCPSARPGALAPHAWLPDGRSLYDAFSPGFTLVFAEDADDLDLVAAQAQAKASNIPLSLVQAPKEVRELFKARLTLVRPDQHIAWRGES